jgi:hypothetical protein
MFSVQNINSVQVNIKIYYYFYKTNFTFTYYILFFKSQLFLILYFIFTIKQYIQAKGKYWNIAFIFVICLLELFMFAFIYLSWSLVGWSVGRVSVCIIVCFYIFCVFHSSFYISVKHSILHYQYVIRIFK